MDTLLGLALFGAAWAAVPVANEVRYRLPSRLAFDLRHSIGQWVGTAWFVICFLAAGFFLSRAYPCGAGCFT